MSETFLRMSENLLMTLNLHFTYKEIELQKVYLLKIVSVQSDHLRNLKARLFSISNSYLFVHGVVQKPRIGNILFQVLCIMQKTNNAS